MAERQVVMDLRSDRAAGRVRVVAAVSALIFLASGCAIVRFSVSSSGVQGNQPATRVIAVTDDGRYSLFSSAATNLVPDDTNASYDVFRHDVTNGRTVRANVAPNGGQTDGTFAGAMNTTGRYVAFATGDALDPADTNGVVDIYVRDLKVNTTSWASQPPTGGYAPNGGADVGNVAISGNGRYVSYFWRSAGSTPEFTIATLYRRDRQTATTTKLTDGNATYDGFIASTNAQHYAVSTSCAHGCSPQPVLVDPNGSAAAWPALPFALCGFDTIDAVSPSGRFIGYSSNSGRGAPCLPSGEYIVDRKTAATTAVNRSVTFQPVKAISRDGKFALLLADGTLTPGGTAGRVDLYLHDVATGKDTRFVTSASGGDQNADITEAVLSRDAHEIGFMTTASDLVGGDTNGVDDVFVRPGLVRPASP